MFDRNLSPKPAAWYQELKQPEESSSHQFQIKVEILRKSGSYVNRGTVIAYVQGPIKDILRGEQVALNIFQRMSGIATETNKFVQELHGTGCAILGTRNTTPLLRALEKQAVIDGGGQTDRLNLSDRIVITANHVAAVGEVKMRPN